MQYVGSSYSQFENEVPNFGLIATNGPAGSARLALDYERGRSARVGYLTNMPRTYGVTARWEF